MQISAKFNHSVDELTESGLKKKYIHEYIANVQCRIVSVVICNVFIHFTILYSIGKIPNECPCEA